LTPLLSNYKKLLFVFPSFKTEKCTRKLKNNKQALTEVMRPRKQKIWHPIFERLRRFLRVILYVTLCSFKRLKTMLFHPPEIKPTGNLVTTIVRILTRAGFGARGAVTVIQSTATNAVRCPCFNHALNLSLGKSATVQSVRNAVGIVKEVVAFFTASAKRNFVLKNVVKGQLIRMCETRWIERHDSLIQFTSELPQIINALTVVSKWHERESASKARCLMSAVSDCEFILAMFCVTDVLSLTLPLSAILQSISMDMASALASVQDILTVLQSRRADMSQYSAVYTAAESVMAELDISVTTPRSVKKQQNRPNPPASSPHEYYWRALYIPLLESVIADLQSRFSGDTINILQELSNLIPAKVVTIDDSRAVAKSLLQKYGDLLNLPSSSAGELQLGGEIDLWRSKWIREGAHCRPPVTASDALIVCDSKLYPATNCLLHLLLTLPVSVATAERSFSTLRRLKTWLRSRMTEQRLTGLALMNIHREHSVSVDAVIDRFAKSKPRLLDFVL
jgi:hypothetical protein